MKFITEQTKPTSGYFIFITLKQNVKTGKVDSITEIDIYKGFFFLTATTVAINNSNVIKPSKCECLEKY